MAYEKLRTPITDTFSTRLADYMTLPWERTSALLQTREFLLALELGTEWPGLPAPVRDEARRLLIHYPDCREMDKLARVAPHHLMNLGDATVQAQRTTEPTAPESFESPRESIRSSITAGHTAPVGEYLRHMWTLSDTHLRESEASANAPERYASAQHAFCWAFLAGNVLLYAASVVGGSAGEIYIPEVADTSPDVSAGYTTLALLPAVREAGRTYALYEDYGRYNNPGGPQPTTLDIVNQWTKIVRRAFRRKYLRYFE